MSQGEERLLSLPEVAGVLGISRSAAYLLAQKGRLPYIRISRRALRVHPADLKAFIQRHRVAGFEGGDAR